MKANKWEFTKYVPNNEDIIAQNKALNKFADWALNQAITLPGVDWFCAGFIRGIKWAEDKRRVENGDKNKDASLSDSG